MGDPSLDVLRILDSLDEYLTLSDSLSSTLRRGWLDLAGARHSMGTSRVTSAVFDLKPHPAAATLHVKLEDESVSDTISEIEEGNHITPCLRHPSFTLSKEHVDSGGGLEPEGQKQPSSVGAELRCWVPSPTCGDISPSCFGLTFEFLFLLGSLVTKTIHHTSYGIHIVLIICICFMLLLEGHQKEQSAN